MTLDSKTHLFQQLSVSKMFTEMCQNSMTAPSPMMAYGFLSTKNICGEGFVMMTQIIPASMLVSSE